MSNTSGLGESRAGAGLRLAETGAGRGGPGSTDAVISVLYVSTDGGVQRPATGDVLAATPPAVGRPATGARYAGVSVRAGWARGDNDQSTSKSTPTKCMLLAK